MLQSRENALASLRARRHVPVLIIGAGINGAGLFRDLSLQGIDCFICDKSDFCAGASAAPSRLIHGGLKYLETGEFRLVAASTLERNLLLRNAPHYVHPLATIVPAFSWFGGIIPSMRRFFRLPAKLTDRGVLILETGLALYDLLGRRARVMPRHRLHLRRRSLADLPALDPKIVATGEYYDAAVTMPERLGLELVLDAMAANPGSLAINHLEIASATGGEVQLRDMASGETFTLTADVVVNAGGAWIDRINSGLGIARHYIGGAKGSHLILDHPELVRQLAGRMVYFGSADGRICLAYPYFGRVLVGSTDVRVEDSDAAICDADEAAYMLEVVAAMFPGVKIVPEQVVYRYCGVRPLPAADVADPGVVSRDHSIGRDVLPGTETPVLSLIGGKWTTFRGFAEEAADLIMAEIKRERRVSTRELPIGGGRDFPANARRRADFVARLSGTSGLARERVEELLERYGTTAEAIIAETAAGDARRLHTLPDYSIGEIERIAREEMVVTLEDMLFRRTILAVTGRLTREVCTEVGAIVARVFGWNEARRDAEIRRALQVAVTRHGVSIEGIAPALA